MGKNAREALEIYKVLGDAMGQAEMYQIIAEMHSSLGEKPEATKMAEKALAQFKAAGSKWGEEQSLQTISALLVERGAADKAPKKGDARQALKDLVKAVESRNVEDVKSAEDKLNSMGNLLAD